MAALIGGLFAWIGKNPDKETSVPKDIPRSKWGFIETSVVVGAMNLLFLIFGVIQVIFLIGGESRIAALGVTYSQYARQGFFQMIAIISTFFFLHRELFAIDFPLGSHQSPLLDCENQP